MFTNWLTSPSTATSTSVAQTPTTTTPSSSSQFLNQLPTNLMTTPPDIILEVGPTPSVRFVAHSSLLAMHSGYLRSAIRLDENNGNLHNTIGGSMELPPIYLTNVTPEQFGPLLTYMYTGYLDLTVENIFGVLLATHVLHMPRALEICRAFLARSQAEGFLNGNYLNQLNNNNNNNNSNNNNNNCELNTTKNSKIIRPIPSKPIISNLGFIVPPMQHISLPSTDTPFRSLCSQNIENLTIKKSNKISSPKLMQKSDESNSSNPSPSCENSNPLESTLKSKQLSISKELTTFNANNQNLTLTTTLATTTSTPTPTLTSTTSIVTKHRSPKLKRSRSKNSSSITTILDQNTTNSSINPIKYNVGQNHITNPNQNQNSVQDNENKVIIDVASCDGPVRFRRVLNDAYGRQPDSVHIPPPQHERTHESVSYSFHQQMAKTICQQRQQQQQQQQHHQQQQHQQQSEESENSEDVKLNSSSNQHGSSSNTSNNGETFNCIYCKHTFKSQYCYQKHAKRHLNPLSLEQGEGIILAPSATSFRDLFKEKTISGITTTNSGITGTNQISNKRDLLTLTSSTSSSSIISPSTKLTGNINNNTNNNNDVINGLESIGNNSNNNNNSILTNNKREVRPLDMNVQYYPCKTCGSKFPSYYFVHKHRKLCHANEEN